MTLAKFNLKNRNPIRKLPKIFNLPVTKHRVLSVHFLHTFLLIVDEKKSILPVFIEKIGIARNKTTVRNGPTTLFMYLKTGESLLGMRHKR